MTLLQPRFLFRLELWLEKVAEYFNPDFQPETSPLMFLPRSFNLDLSTLIFQPQPFNPDYSNPNPYGVVVFMVESQGLKVGVENFGGWNVLQPIGKASPFQLIVMALLEIVLYETNEHIGRHYIKARINQL